MPDAVIAVLIGTLADWLRRQRVALAHCFWPLWDKLAGLAYDPARSSGSSDPGDSDEREMDALNRPGGVLAWAAVEQLAEAQRADGSGLGADFEERLTRLARASGSAGLEARHHLVRNLNRLFRLDPDWTRDELLPRLAPDHPEFVTLWSANAQTGAGPPALFNALKPALFAVLSRPELNDTYGANLFVRLFQILVEHQLGRAADYHLTTGEMRDFLATCPERLRSHLAWLFWRLQGDAPGDEEPVDPRVATAAERWRNLVQPIFTKIWPLDGQLRTPRASRSLVQMALETADAFPEAVDHVAHVLASYEVFSVQEEFRVDAARPDLIARFPAAVVRLANALIDPRHGPPPRDLGKFLDDCLSREPSLATDPSFLRLSGLRRLGGA